MLRLTCVTVRTKQISLLGDLHIRSDFQEINLLLVGTLSATIHLLGKHVFREIIQVAHPYCRISRVFFQTMTAYRT